MRCYYIDSEQQQQGPFPDLWVAQLIYSGCLDINTQIWGEQIGEWMTWEEYVVKSLNYIECTYCGSQLSIESEHFGKKLQCPECNSKFIAYPVNSSLLWNMFEHIKSEEETSPNVQQWLKERNKLHSKSSSSVEINKLGILTAGYINTIISERDENKIVQVNQIVSVQIFLLCCLVLTKQLRRTSILEFREYCALVGLSAAAYDKILSCELSKAFIAINYDNIDYNEINYFKIIAEYCANNINNEKETFFLPTYNALIPWYYNALLKSITDANYLDCLGDFQKLVVLPCFRTYSRILKEEDFQKTLENILCHKIESGNFSKTDFTKLNEILSPLPFGMEWLYNSDIIQEALCTCFLKSFELLLQGRTTDLPDFVYDMLPDISALDNKIAKKLLPTIINKKKSFDEVKHIFGILEHHGFGIIYGENLFTLRRIFPYFLTDDTSSAYTFPVLYATQEESSCPSCSGYGKLVCPKCSGTKKMNCPECNGRGQIYSSKSHKQIYCPKCQGRKKITCDNNCQGDRSITDELRYYIKCKQCNGSKKVDRMTTVCIATFRYNRERCIIINEKSQILTPEPPFKQFSPLKHMDSKMASFCKGKDCFFFADNAGRIFCGEHNQVSGINSEYMIEVISKFYTSSKKTKSTGKRNSNDSKTDKKTTEKKGVELTNNEKLYLKSYMVANKDSIIDAAERKMLEYQALNILKLTPERVGELEALAQFLNEEDL